MKDNCPNNKTEDKSQFSDLSESDSNTTDDSDL